MTVARHYTITYGAVPRDDVYQDFPRRRRPHHAPLALHEVTYHTFTFPNDNAAKQKKKHGGPKKVVFFCGELATPRRWPDGRAFGPRGSHWPSEAAAIAARRVLGQSRPGPAPRPHPCALLNGRRGSRDRDAARATHSQTLYYCECCDGMTTRRKHSKWTYVYNLGSTLQNNARISIKALNNKC